LAASQTIGRLSIGVTIMFLSTASCFAQKNYDPGVSDTEIKLGQTSPYSGPASAFSTASKAEVAYFKMVNERGGINGRVVNLISYDDAYSPPKTVEQVRKLVEGDEVLAIVGLMGTPTNAAVQKYLNARKVPQLLVATGANRFSNPKDFPWTIGFSPSFQSEAHVYAQYILQNYPAAKIAILYQNDDYGKDYLKGLKDAFGDKASKLIVAEASYEVTDPTADSQLVTLKTSGADVYFNAASPKFAAQAIKKMGELGWKPIHFLNINASSVGAVMRPAGAENSKGIMSVNYSKDPLDPQWKNDPGMARYYAFMDKYFPDGDKASGFNVYGYMVGQTLEEILTRCGDNLTRENLLKVATSLQGVKTDMDLPGMAGASTAPTDYRLHKEFQMMRFDGERWELFGPILRDEMSAGN
jgi:branched-chain amino acid transport system substrate-binding protein